MIASRALNLPARELYFTFQMLLAMWALKFEFAGSHTGESLAQVNLLRQQKSLIDFGKLCQERGAAANFF